MIVPLIILSLYFIILLIFIFGWKKIIVLDKNTSSAITSLPFVSIVIAVRNEEKHIASLLHGLGEQNYDTNLYEVIIVNDFSTDATEKIILSYKKQVNYKLKLIQNKKSNSPKKQAIELAVSEAKGELILVTDGDCHVPCDWVSCHARAYKKTGAFFIAAPVKISLTENTFFQKLQQLEFASLIASGAACLHLGYPSMANAANMSFSKEVFKEIGGYKHTGATPSGDDELLMHKISKAYPDKLIFLKEKHAIVTTAALTNINSFLNQRKRWGSKWKHYQLYH